MTTTELRTSISADLDLLSVEMLENVSNYVKRLARRSRNVKVPRHHVKMEDALSFVKSLSVTGGMPIPADERGIDSLLEEKYCK